MAGFWLLYIFGAIILLIYYIRHKSNKYPKTFWSSRGFTSVGSETTGSKILNKKSIMENDTLIYNKAKLLGKPFVGIMNFSKPELFVKDLDLLKFIFVKDFDNFMDRRKLFDSEKDKHELFAKVLFFMENEPWKDLRSKMSPTFTTGKIRRMFEIFEISSKNLVECLEKLVLSNNSEDCYDNEVELADPLGRLTLDVITSAAFGLDAKSFVEDRPVFQVMAKRLQDVFDLSLRLFAVIITKSLMPSFARALKLGITDQVSVKFFNDVLLHTIRHRESTGEKRNDFLQLMLEARDGQLKDADDNELSTFEKEAKITESKYQTKLTDDTIVAQCIAFLLAGFDTTKTLLLFVAYELALNPDIQEKLYKEIENAQNDSDGKFIYENINNMEYLDKIVNETLRKYPPVARLERRAVADYKIPETELVIPKDTLIIIPTYCIHHDPEVFPNPSKFDAERFSKESKAKRHPYAFQPFGHGPRNCLGMRFALTNSKMAIANLVIKFKIEPSKKTMIPMEFAKAATLKPEGGKLFLKLTSRA